MRALRTGVAACGLVWALLSPVSAPAQEDAAKKAAVPEPAAQKEAEKLLRDVFKEEYAKKQPADRAALSRKMIGQVAETKDDPATRYVLLREARDLAVQAGDADLAFRAIGELGKYFAVEVIPLKGAVVAGFAKNARTSEELINWARTSLALAAEAVALEDFEGADKQAEAAAALAKRGKDPALVGKADAQRKTIAEKKSRSDQIKSARAKLEADPKDPAASFLVGQYEALVRGNWAKGLPLLAQGSEATYKDLAQRDLDHPKTPGEQMELADGWWDLREKDKGAARENLGARALHWYNHSWAKLTGLNRTKAEQRVFVLRMEQLAKGEWVDVTDPSLFGRKGRAGDTIEIPAKAGEAVSLVLEKFPAGDFDGLTVRIRPLSKELKSVIVLFEAQIIGAGFEPDREECTLLRRLNNGDQWHIEARGKMPRVNEFVLTLLLQEGEYVAFVDGQEYARQRTTNARISRLELVTNGASSRFDQVRLRRRA